MQENEPHKLESPNKRSRRYADKRAIAAAAAIAVVLLILMIVKGAQPISHQTGSHMHSVTATAAPLHEAQDMPLAFLVSGTINQMFFNENAEIKRGDILATLDKAPFEAALASAKAQLALAQADSAKASHIPTSNFNAIEAARANVETAQHVFDDAHAELEKRRGILVAGQLDNVFKDDVQNEHDAELALQRARRELAQQEDAAGNNSNREQYQAAISAAQTSLALAESNMTSTQLVAPAAGVISERKAEVGATVQSGTPVYILSVPTSDNH